MLTSLLYVGANNKNPVRPFLIQTHSPLRMAANRSERASLMGIIPSMVDFLVEGAASTAD